MSRYLPRRRILLCGALGLSSLVYAQEEAELSLADLMDLNVATLVRTDPRDVPASVYSFDAKTLEASSAQTLTDFLQWNVPGAYTMEHTWVTPLWGFRGIMNDRSENVLVSVNGESQNLLSKVGVESDAILGLYEDVQRLDVIAGPGSVVHGGGALAGVVSLQLKDGVGEQPNQLRFSMSSEKGGSAEVARSFQFGKERYLRLSGGFSVYNEESDGYRSQNLIPGWEFNNPNFVHTGRDFGPNSRVTGVYTDLTHRFKIWGRYTSASFNSNYLKDVEADSRYKDTTVNNGVGGVVLSRRHFHKNFSSAAEWTLPLMSELSLKTVLAHTEAASGIERARSGTVWGRNKQLTYDGDLLDGIGEMRSRARADLIYDNKLNPVVLAAEFRHDYFGDVPMFLNEIYAHPGEYPKNQLGGRTIKDVQYTNLALIGEYQARWADPIVRPIVGVRFDKHTWSQTVAPRLALTRSFMDKHFLRATWQQSYKALSADNLEGNVEVDTITSLPSHDQEPSSNETWEVGYNYEGSSLQVRSTLFNNKLKIYTWNDVLKRQSENNLTTRGGEVSATWKAETWGAQLSHSLVRMGDVEKDSAGAPKNTSFTVDGDHLLNYLEDITRLNGWVDVGQHLRLTAKAQVWWPFIGREDIADSRKQYLVEHPVGNSKYLAMRDIDAIWAPQLKLNAGVTLKLSNGNVSVQMENIAGLWDDTNKGRPAYDAGAGSQSIVYLTDLPRARLDWNLQF